MSSKFYNEIKDSKIEKEVELVYNKEIIKSFPNIKIKHPYGCDGYLDGKVEFNEKTRVLKMIMEFKLDEDFGLKIRQSKVLIQVIYYIKRFLVDGKILPNIILIGDKNECFVLHSNSIIKYLDEDVDWNIAPSHAANNNPKLMLKLKRDEEINPFVFRIDNNFRFQDVVKKIEDLALNIQRFVKISEANISVIYDYFISKVVRNAKSYNANELVYTFINLMILPKDSYLHPNKKNILVLSNNKEILIDGLAYKAFFNYFDRKYTPQEKDKFSEISDRLIEDTKRRFKGEFYTPTVWVNEAHRLISNMFGYDWKEKYVVWDCAWGTGNLTRDYNFKQLYCSTINQSDLDIGCKYNTNSIKFQYDFLNDDKVMLKEETFLEYSPKIPLELLNAFRANKPIIFLINPPYATANNSGTTEGDHKKGVALTYINKIMNQEKIGSCSQQLSAQFLYRIFKIKELYNLTNINICVFASPLYMTGGSYKEFRKKFLNEFSFNKGILLKGDNFADVKGSWGISFAIWKSGQTVNKNEFLHEIKEVENGDVINDGNKVIYNLDGKISFSDWIKEDVQKIKTIDAPQLASALTVKNVGRGRLIDGALGYYVNVSNNVYKNASDVFLLSSAASTANGISITEKNIMKVVSNFAARKLITGKYSDWINQKDEYIIPENFDDDYERWNNDALIFSLFHTSSNQSSLRNITYKNKSYNIINHFFFMGIDEMKALANKHKNYDIYQDIKYFSKERYVYELIRRKSFSVESEKLLEFARELVINSFEFREAFNEDNGKYKINTWDCGWYQIKGLLKEYMSKELKEFNGLFKVLEDKMRPMIYELGFLKK